MKKVECFLNVLRILKVEKINYSGNLRRKKKSTFCFALFARKRHQPFTQLRPLNFYDRIIYGMKYTVRSFFLVYHFDLM